MDQILHRKLVNEKNNLELQVAKANKQIAQLSEQVKQYETLLASLDEGMIPSQMRLRGGSINQAGVHEKKFVASAAAQGRKLTSAEQAALVQHEKNDAAANARIAAEKARTVSEATLVRGMEAIKLRASMGKGKKLPTPKEAAAEMERIKAAKELEDAGLGKLKKSRMDEGFGEFMQKIVNKVSGKGFKTHGEVARDEETAADAAYAKKQADEAAAARAAANSPEGRARRAARAAAAQREQESFAAAARSRQAEKDWKSEKAANAANFGQKGAPSMEHHWTGRRSKEI